MRGYIYTFTNNINNKIYVGQTIQKLSARYRQHILDSKKKHYPLYRAIRKYGIDNFTFKVLETIEKDDKQILIDTLNNLEITYISKLDCLLPKGYNISEGGKNHIGACRVNSKLIFDWEIPIIDTINNIEYENTYEWLVINRLTEINQYDLFKSDYRFQYKYKNNINLGDSDRIREEQDEKIQKNIDDIAEIQRENRQMKLEIEELKKRLNKNNPEIIL